MKTPEFSGNMTESRKLFYKAMVQDQEKLIKMGLFRDFVKKWLDEIITDQSSHPKLVNLMGAYYQIQDEMVALETELNQLKVWKEGKETDSAHVPHAYKEPKDQEAAERVMLLERRYNELFEKVGTIFDEMIKEFPEEFSKLQIKLNELNNSDYLTKSNSNN
jgi:hydroxymethylpyrimidine pyrophosphatase-like HAD family hydrolase